MIKYIFSWVHHASVASNDLIANEAKKNYFYARQISGEAQRVSFGVEFQIKIMDFKLKIWQVCSIVLLVHQV